MTNLNDLIASADYKDRHNTGKKKWAQQYEQQQQEEIKLLEEKEIRKLYK